MSTITTEITVSKVIVHPLVLLSVVDHYNRMDKAGSKTRVVGALLGGWRGKGVLDISNSFAVPFDEEDRDKDVWFLDHDYMESMYNMFKKVNAREKIVGWYHTGPKLHPNDVAINEIVRRLCPNAVLVIVDVKPREVGLPTDAYVSVEEVHDDGTPTTKTFEHVPSEIGAEEAEEVGVEHLLRDIKDTRVGTLSQKITDQLHGLKGLHIQLREIHQYLAQVVNGTLPVNHQIIYQVQDIFNLLPDVSTPEHVEAMMVRTNDQMLSIYVPTLVRSVIALHNLISNKLTNREAEKKENLAGKAKEEKEKLKEQKEAAAAAAEKLKESGDAKKEES